MKISLYVFKGTNKNWCTAEGAPNRETHNNATENVEYVHQLAVSFRIFEILNVWASGPVEALFEYFQREWLPAIWHSCMNKRLRKHHLGFYQFLQLITDEQGKTETEQMDEGYTRGRGSVRRSAAYRAQQRRVVALTAFVMKSRNISVQSSLLIATDESDKGSASVSDYVERSDHDSSSEFSRTLSSESET
ncbi:hypothetical protein T4B_6430 [Trichinella pseudospiralis]|uniref:Uncharacterized protein n=1 Tax=Trichinella pseudospiralis TaxID=6337 RepID=A0A0V1IE09_TRIPS|nr:hypothetical protein T4B_6430 [Trichinella pseudospiralis]